MKNIASLLTLLLSGYSYAGLQEPSLHILEQHISSSIAYRVSQEYPGLDSALQFAQISPSLLFPNSNIQLFTTDNGQWWAIEKSKTSDTETLRYIQPCDSSLILRLRTFEGIQRLFDHGLAIQIKRFNDGSMSLRDRPHPHFSTRRLSRHL